jgi:hypothetical protein
MIQLGGCRTDHAFHNSAQSFHVLVVIDLSSVHSSNEISKKILGKFDWCNIRSALRNGLNISLFTSTHVPPVAAEVPLYRFLVLDSRVVLT